ncbi:hypothetical protein NR798_36790 [Archangium gephyra]|uniref:hypothetical protein n=1 Tax=Archangium gephyra TaxID=48 RepID=UPI0035D40CB5
MDTCAGLNASTLKSYYGTIVSGSDFWPRPEIVDPLVRSLLRGQSHTLFGLRRTGKSSIMAEAKSRMEAQGVIVSQINAESGKGLQDVFGELLRNLPAPDLKNSLLRRFEQVQNIAQPVLGLVRGWIGHGPAPTGSAASERDLLDYWPTLSPMLFEALKAETRPIALFVDELPFLIENTLTRGAGADRKQGHGLATAQQILVTLREWRGLKHVAMLVAGSIGMRGLALRHGLDPGAFNDMLPVPLPPLRRDEAVRMVQALVAGAAPPLPGWTEAATETLLDGLPDLYPGFIQLGFQSVADRGATTPEDIRHSLREHLEPQLHHQFFGQFDNRLRREELALRRHLTAAIDLVVDSAAQGGLPLDAFHAELVKRGCEMPEEIAAILREDGFLTFDPHVKNFRPASAMVAAWRNSTPRARSR